MSHLSYAAPRNAVSSPAFWQIARDFYRATPIAIFLQALKGL